MGSFLGLLLDRFPEYSIIKPASHCYHCKRRLKVRDLIPILSQIYYGFRCSHCQHQTPIRYCLMELACALIFLFWSLSVIDTCQVLFLLFSLLLSLYDLKEHSYPLLVWLFFQPLFLLLLGFNQTYFLFLALALLTQFFPLKIGAGDFLYLASISLYLTWRQSLLVIFLSSLLGILYIFLSRKKEEIPFLPFLSVSFLFLLF